MTTIHEGLIIHRSCDINLSMFTDADWQDVMNRCSTEGCTVFPRRALRKNETHENRLAIC